MSLTENSTPLAVAENSLATAILIPTPSDTSYTSATETVTPSDATVLLADGITPVYVGEVLTVAPLTGLRFRSTITGIRCYTGSQHTGTHVGDLWSASGTLLAAANFTNEPASGWQQVNLSKPVAITAGTKIGRASHRSSALTGYPQVM